MIPVGVLDEKILAEENVNLVSTNEQRNEALLLYDDNAIFASLKLTSLSAF